MSNPESTPAESGGRIVALLIVAQLAYGLAFLWQSSFVIAGERYFMLFDDAMISMGYARTLAHGGGLVWYPGAETVQGYTNFLWTILMAGVHLLPVPTRLTPGVFQALSLCCVPLTSIYAWRIHRLLCPTSTFSWIPIVLVGTYFPLYQWAGLGMEAGFVTLLLTALSYEVFRAERDGAVRPAAFLLMATGVLTRLDFAIFAALGGVALLAACRPHPRQLRRTLKGLGAVGVTIIALCAWQLLYYGDWLPNTFALKLGVPIGIRIARGLESVHGFLSAASYIVVAVALTLFVRNRTVSRQAKWYLLSTISIALSYDVYAGGDAWEWGSVANRFVLPVVPLLLLAIAVSIDALVRPIASRPRQAGLALAATVFVVLRLNAGTFEPDTALSRLRQAALLEPIFTREVHDRFVLRAGLFIREATTRPVTIAITSAGIAPYVIEDARFNDILGRSDRLIAQLAPRDTDFLPGHVKWDLAHSITALEADLSIGAPPGEVDEPPKYFTGPVLRIPGILPIFISRAAVGDAIVPLPELVELFRRYLGGSGARLLGYGLELRGFRFSPTRQRFDLVSAGSLTVPSGTELSFEATASGPLAFSIRENGTRSVTSLLAKGDSYRYSVAATKDVRVEISAHQSASSADNATLSIGMLELR